MRRIFHLQLLFTSVFILIAAGCTDNLLDASESSVPPERVESNRPDTKLRHPQFVGRSSNSVAAKLGAADSHVFVAFNEYEADGITRRVLDAYGITRRVLSEYGITRRVLDAYGISRRILSEYGVTHRVLDSYGITRRVLDSYGITAEYLDKYSHDIDALLAEFGVSMEELEAQGITRRVLEEYAITRRVMDEYGVSDQAFDEAIAAFERTLRLKVRIDGARPGIFLSLGTLPLAVFLDEVLDDDDIAFVEMDLEMEGPSIGSITKTNGGDELMPWGVSHIGANNTASTGLDAVHVYVLDSGMYESTDLNIVERKDFSMLFVNRDQSTWDDSKLVEMPYFDPGNDGNPADETGHGTHLAGTIGALANGQGVIGAAKGVMIHSLKVMTAAGRTDVTTVMAALDYVIVQKQASPATPMVVNLSLGMNIESTAYNVLDEGVKRATEHGIVVVVSAGNAESDAATFSPAHVAEAVTVGAYGPSGAFSTFSNFGPTVDVLAPGDLIPSLSNNPMDEAANYAILESGTSMAAAHATGAVALLLAANPNAQPQFVRAALIGSALPTVTGVPSGTTALALRAGPSAIQDATLPPFMQFAVSTNGNIDLKGGTSITVPEGSQWNSSVYSGGVLGSSGGTVQGFGYYVSAQNTADYFTPNFNPGGLDATHRIDPIQNPELDISAFGSLATRHTDGDLFLEGEMALGTPDAPVIWYVTGGLYTSAAITVKGFGVFVVEGQVQISKAVISEPESEMAIYAGGFVGIKSGSTGMDAHIYSNDTVVLAKSSILRGSITSVLGAGLATGASVEYSPIPCQLTEPFWPTGTCASGGTTTPGGPTTEPSPPAPEQISLTTEPRIHKRKHVVDLTWSNAVSPEVDIYRNGTLVATAANTGAWSDATGGRKSATYTHRVCEAGTDICSPEATTVF